MSNELSKRKISVGDFILTDEDKQLILEICNSNRISEGKYVNLFEKEFANIIGTKHCTLVNSGTSALIVALTALLYDDRYPKIKKGAKVLTTPLTYIATSNAIKLVGLKPVFVDINLDTFDINVDLIEELLKQSSDDYCMILPVHLMGYPCDMDRINELAQKYDLVIFEDAAQAHGTKYNGKNVGNLSLCADYSFYTAHNISCTEMGAVVTNDSILNTRIKQLKANGRMCSCKICTRMQGTCPYKDEESDPRFSHEYIGYNFKTTEFSAGLGYLQLQRFDSIIKKRLDNVKYLNDGLVGLRDFIKLPIYDENVSYLAYPIVVNPDKVNRKWFMNKLAEYGIESRPLFGCIPIQQPAYKEYKELYNGKLPVAEYLGNNGMYIGCHQYLGQDDLDYVIEMFYKILK